MSLAGNFKDFLDNLKISKKSAEIYSNRYKEITRKLNKHFTDCDSTEKNCLQVGSYGRFTGIDVIFPN